MSNFHMILLCSYLYYILDEATPLTDYQYDKMLHDLTPEELDVPYGHLITPEHQACGSLFDIPGEDYPNWVNIVAREFVKTGKL